MSTGLVDGVEITSISEHEFVTLNVSYVLELEDQDKGNNYHKNSQYVNKITSEPSLRFREPHVLPLNVVRHDCLLDDWPLAIYFSQFDPIILSLAAASAPEDVATFNELPFLWFLVSIVGFLKKLYAIHRPKGCEGVDILLRIWILCRHSLAASAWLVCLTGAQVGPILSLKLVELLLQLLVFLFKLEQFFLVLCHADLRNRLLSLQHSHLC